MSYRSIGIRLRLGSVLILLGSLATVSPAAAKTITIKAVFKYTAPDGTVKPIRYARVELRDVDTVSDDVVGSSFTGSDGAVTFQYDSGLDDGWFGGRIDPYVRCYPKLFMPSFLASNAGGTTQWTELARVGQDTGLGAVEPDYLTIGTPTWEDNDSDRTSEVTATGDAAKTFFIMDCALMANLPASSEQYRAPMALGDLWVFPGATFDTGLSKTAYLPDTNIILIDLEDLDFDSTLHEYGHYEMCRYYGGSFGNYDCTRGNHSFEEPLKNKWYLPSDAEWSALAEAWADFGPVITKRQPIYHGYNVETAAEANLAAASASCEGTVCRIFWDIADTWTDKVLDFDGNVVERPLQAGMMLDDDPFGFSGRGSYAALPGWDALKDIIRANTPKSLGAIRDAWRAKYPTNHAALRAFDAVFWINGLLHGELQENAPTCALHANGVTAPIMVQGVMRDAYVGDLSLTAEAADLEAEDRPFLHVYFYWAYMAQRPETRGRIPEDRSQWNLIGVDIDGSNGFAADWPDGVDRPLPGREVCLIAVASDFMMESSVTFAFDPANRTGGQIWSVVFGESATAGLIADEFKDLVTAPMIVAGPHTMVLCDDGTVLSWGSAQRGIMGDGVKTASRSRVRNPIEAPLLNGVVAIDGDSHRAVALRADGTVWVWGKAQFESSPGTDWSRPQRVEGLDDVKAVSSRGITLVIRSDDSLWGWNVSTSRSAPAELGFDYGKRIRCDAPMALPVPVNIAALAAGSGHNLVIDDDGNVWSFGPGNKNGELGRGDTADKPLPKKVVGLHDVVSVAVGWFHCLAACRDGSVWAWGAGNHGALGDGTLEDRLVPVRVRGLAGAKAVAAGTYSSYALREDGTVWAWGSGYLGVSAEWNEDYLLRQVVPRQVLNLSDAIAISAQAENALALRGDGSVWAWGTNDWGAIGDGTRTLRPLPVQVPGVNVFKRKNH
jgi:alpha-tubulin suppressor-like RCC1 family protein